MKHFIKIALVIAAAAVFLHRSAQAQLAKQNLTVQQISEAIEKISLRHDEESKAELLKEAKALVDAKNESYNRLGAAVYYNLGDTKTAYMILNGLAKKYPAGAAARDAEMEEIFEDKSKTLDQKITAYRAWLHKFPVASFEAYPRTIYSKAAVQIGTYMILGNRVADAMALIRENAGTPEYSDIAYNIANFLGYQHHTEALALLEEAAGAIDTEKGPDRTKDAILRLYAQMLADAGKANESIEVYQSLIKRQGHRVRPDDVLALANVYRTLDRDQDAFQTLEDFLVHHSIHDDVLTAIEPLYNKLNNPGDFTAYRSELKARNKKALIAKYKDEMIERDAPDFTLADMQGETVRLSDYRGKIVILDFWATWCLPCIGSFPGMQAAVNKYANDPEVAFLFINTLQNEANYKELVTNFIDKHDYTFHVVYDEMSDRDKATVTAYGIKSIPTKVFIDPEGRIRFQSTGGSANVDKVVGEMEAKIELIKEAARAGE